MEHRTLNWKKYAYSFSITAVIFVTAIFISKYVGDKRLNEIRNIQDHIAIDILSSETQFSLLAESSCSDIGTGSLSTELGTLEQKLTYTENQRGYTDPEVQILKQYYFLLEIKDYLLMNKISEKCKKTPLSIIYFYSTDDNCDDCEREGYVLTKLRETYPELRVYSFDYNIELAAVKTLISTYKIKDTLPAIVIKGKQYNGFQSVETLEKAIPELALMKAKEEAKNATTTKK